MKLGAVLLGERHVGQHVGFGIVHQSGELWHFRAHLIGNGAPLLTGGLRRFLRKGCADEGRDDTPAAFAGMGQGIAHEVDAAALPCRAQQLGDCRLDAFVGVGDHQLHPAQPSACQLAQKGRPERLGFRRPDIHAQYLAPTIAVDAYRDDHRDRDDPAILADFDIGGVDPQVRPVALDRAVEEGMHFLVELFTQPADLALRDAIHAQRLDQIIDRPRRDAVHIGFLDHCGQRPLGHPARFEKAGKVAALAQFGDAQFDRAGAGLPVAIAIAVALDEPVGGFLAVRGARQAANLHLHQPPGGIGDHVAQNIRIRGLLDQRAQVHHGIGHRGSPGSGFATQTYPKITVTTRADGRTLQRNIESARPASCATVRSYTTCWDAAPFKPTSLSIRRDEIDATAALGLPGPMSLPTAGPNRSARPRE